MSSVYGILKRRVCLEGEGARSMTELGEVMIDGLMIDWRCL